MVGIITRNATPETLEEIARDARPFDAYEIDCMVRMQFPSGLFSDVPRRVRYVRLVSADQNSLHTVRRDMGPATGEDGCYIPCDDVVEMAHVHELLDGAIERRRRRAAVRALFRPERERAMREGVRDFALDQIERKKGRSTFGYGGKLQRSS